MGIRFCIVLDNYGLKKEFSKFMICLSIIKLSFFFPNSCVFEMDFNFLFFFVSQMRIQMQSKTHMRHKIKTHSSDVDYL